MANNRITGDIVKEYLERFKNIPSLTLAKKIFAENPLPYKDVEQVRGIIRIYRGQSGIKNLHKLTDKKFLKPAGSYNPFQLPESDCDPWEPYIMPSSCNKGLIIADLHVPYHDVRAVNMVIEHALNRKINTILIDGDALDCYQLSRFVRDPRSRSLSGEIWQFIEFLNILQSTFPGIKIVWKLGNHEERLETYLRIKAPELLDMEEYKFEEIIKIRGIEGVKVIGNQQIIQIGRLPVLHGHEFQMKGSNPVNPARGLFLKTLTSAITAHHHRSSSHSELDIKEKLMSWWSIGCLCGLHPEYARLNKWNHGFAYYEFEGLEFSIENYKIYKNNIYRD